ncbi:MAG: hypothetical protein J7M17_00980, partial [Anaerolineae bacterium]|nr:hypothetical protein [Anaerolineae bacterium]
VVRVKIPHCIVIPHASGQAPERSEGSRSPLNEIPSLIAFGTGYSVRNDSSPHTTGNPKEPMVFSTQYLGEKGLE